MSHARGQPGSSAFVSSTTFTEAAQERNIEAGLDYRREVPAMPVKIPDTLPAMGILESENIFVMGENRAGHQDIRPLRVAILNLMPTKIATETQLLRLLGNTPLQVEVELLHMDSHTPGTRRPSTCSSTTRPSRKSGSSGSTA